ncbi:MAG: sugar transferase, partial [Fimbriimonadaceae bacterium]
FDWERDLPNPISRGRMLLVSYWLIVAGAVITGRMLLRTTQRRLLENGIGLHRTVIVGWGAKARELYQNISKYPALGYRVIGFVAPTASDRLHRFHGVPVLGVLDRLGDIVVRHQVEDILIALQKQDQDALVKIIAQTDGLPVSLKIVPDLYSIITGQARTNQIYGFPLIEILPQYMPAWERLAKRAIDVLVSLLVLVLGLPLWLLIALAIRMDSPGSIFYRQERVGKHGLIFEVIKFRSMVAGADQKGSHSTASNDPRITRVGAILRKTSLDELPQLWNVVKGDMSLVGPRPDTPKQETDYTPEQWQQRHQVRPGITGLAQVKGRNVSTLEERTAYDLEYVAKSSLGLDLQILVWTVKQVLGKGSF